MRMILLFAMALITFSGCSDASVARNNLEKAEQNFEIVRRAEGSFAPVAQLDRAAAF